MVYLKKKDYKKEKMVLITGTVMIFIAAILGTQFTVLGRVYIEKVKFMENKGSPLAALGSLNWEKTRAYLCSPGSMTINLNLQGREPTGTVAQDDFERVRDEVIAALSEWRSLESGKRVFQWVARPEQIYEGKRVGMAPDLFFSLEPGMHAVALGFGRPLWRVRGLGQHAPHGLGASAKNGQRRASMVAAFQP